MSGLETMIPQPVVVSAGGREIAVTPIRVRELPAFMRAVEPIIGMIAAGGDMAALLAHNADAVIEATAIGARVERGFVDELELDELLGMAAAVLEVNADFFVQRLLPAFTAASERMAKKLGGLSLTPDSAPPDSEGA